MDRCGGTASESVTLVVGILPAETTTLPTASMLTPTPSPVPSLPQTPASAHTETTSVNGEVTPGSLPSVVIYVGIALVLLTDLPAVYLTQKAGYQVITTCFLILH